jgi:chromosome segregation ATPase
MADTEQTQTEQDAATATEAEETEQATDLGDAGKEAIRKEREKARAAQKEAKELRDRLAAIEADQQKAADDKAVKDGEFERLATERQAKLDKAKTDFDALKADRDDLAAKVQQYEDRDRKAITDGVSDLPEDLRAFDPGQDAPLAQRMDWFTKAQAIAAKRTTDPIRGNGRSPESANGRDARADEAAREAQARTFHSRF